MDYKAIETYYNGYRFRSRLEARWAVFFDALGIKYEYEPEGYIGLNDIYYLPDFYLPEENVYVEVKGSDDALHQDQEKICAAIDFSATPCSEGLIILGNIPDPSQIGWGNIPMFSYLYCHKGIRCEYAAFTDYSLICGNDRIIRCLYSYDADLADFFSSDGLPKSVSVNSLWTNKSLLSRDSWDKLKNAYLKARQARFEHGEKPIF